ncbi:MAG: murein L,D-transpeptidase [Neomegalonema sp.]|nr:murein L,D-transpeptidase [Neomegalonema sp.]
MRETLIWLATCVAGAALFVIVDTIWRVSEDIAARMPMAPKMPADAPFQRPLPTPAPPSIGAPLFGYPIPRLPSGSLAKQLAAAGLKKGAPIFIRVFKKTRELEVWLQDSAPGRRPRYRLFKSYPICAYSGDLGPKLKEGDRQSPEGFYFVTPSAMNPNSSYHLSFNIGFPNAYDRAHGRTGSYLMVHGDCVSIGCYAMTDAGIEEIYTLAKWAFADGQPFFRIHIFPFRMTDSALATHAGSRWTPFWTQLRAGHDLFERDLSPPNVTVKNKAYEFAPTAPAPATEG